MNKVPLFCNSQIEFSYLVICCWKAVTSNILMLRSLKQSNIRVVSVFLFSCSVMSDSSWPHGLQHIWLPCSSLSPRACSNSCLLSQWCHPTISSSVVPSSCLESLPASGSFPVSWFFASCGQSIGAAASVLSMNIQGWFLLGITREVRDWLVWSPCSPRNSQEFSPTPQFKSINSSVLSFLYGPALTSVHDYWKNHSFD